MNEASGDLDVIRQTIAALRETSNAIAAVVEQVTKLLAIGESLVTRLEQLTRKDSA